MSADGPEVDRPMLEKTVIDMIAKQKQIPSDGIMLDSTFEELGVDSLDAMEVLFEVEEQMDVDIPDTAVRSMNDVRDVVDGLEKLMRGEEIAATDAIES